MLLLALCLLCAGIMQLLFREPGKKALNELLAPQCCWIYSLSLQISILHFNGQ
jgi:hypothetical protein